MSVWRSWPRSNRGDLSHTNNTPPIRFMTDSDPFAKTGDWEEGDSERIAQDPTYSAPSRVGRYRIERVLGSGGFGVVYLATDEQLDRQVAVKIPHRYLIESCNNVAEYLREARTVANLDHANMPLNLAGPINTSTSSSTMDHTSWRIRSCHWSGCGQS